MAQIDMSDALLDPMMLESFKVFRRQQSTNNFGETTMQVSVALTFGVVTITGSNDLERGTDEEHDSKTISIVTRYPLRTAGVDCQPDLISWHGDYYQIATLEDYSSYGLGWMQAVAKSQDFIDEPQLTSLYGQFDFSQPDQSGLTKCF